MTENAATITEFVRCLGVMSHSRAGWDYDLPPAQKAKEDRDKKTALAVCRDIWRSNPHIHDKLRAAFSEMKPLATMKEIEVIP